MGPTFNNVFQKNCNWNKILKNKSGCSCNVCEDGIFTALILIGLWINVWNENIMTINMNEDDSVVAWPVLKEADQTRVESRRRQRVHLLLLWGKHQAFCSYTATWGAAPRDQLCSEVEWLTVLLLLLLLSAVSDLGSQSRVLLANGLVVLQDPLQVGHRLVPMFALNLRHNRHTSLIPQWQHLPDYCNKH